MNYIWDKQSIEWFLNASSYTGFHATLARKIIPLLEPGGTLCDVGCGLGILDLELAPYVSKLTAIDVNEDAIAVLKREVERSGIKNLRAECCDAMQLEGSFDTVIISFVGGVNLLNNRKLTCRRIIRIISAENKGSLYPERHRSKTKETVPLVTGELIAHSLRFRLEMEAIEFGQPLKSRMDAEQFILKNAPDATAEEIDSFIDENVELTGRDDFPLYLPNKKQFGIFVIDMEGS